MDWEVIGVVAEIVGAVAIIITLIYLSVQMRLAREASQLQSSYSTIEVYGNWRTHLIENERLAATVAKANRGESLTSEEDIQVATLMDDLFIALSISQASGAKSMALYDPSAEIEYVNRIFAQLPGLAPYWNRTRDFIMIIGPDFAKAVDVLMSETKYPFVTDSTPNKNVRTVAT